MRKKFQGERKKNHGLHKGTNIDARFLQQQCKLKKQWNDIFKVLKVKKKKRTTQNSVEGENNLSKLREKYFLKQKLREFGASKPAL